MAQAGVNLGSGGQRGDINKTPIDGMMNYVPEVKE